MTGDLVTKELTRIESHASATDKPACKCPAKGDIRAACSRRQGVVMCRCKCHLLTVRGVVPTGKPTVHEGGPYSRKCVQCDAPIGEYCTSSTKLPHQVRLYEVVPAEVARKMGYMQRAASATRRRFGKTG